MMPELSGPGQYGCETPAVREQKRPDSREPGVTERVRGEGSVGEELLAEFHLEVIHVSLGISRRTRSRAS